MKFRLSIEDPGNGEHDIAEADFANFAAAHEWAKPLLGERSDDATPYLRSGDNTIAARYVRTAGGEWYAIASPAKPVREESA